ncbi:hypothetical protein VYU27_000794 [Nannochloropsis oceanica]
MGIQGLLGALKPITTPVHIRELQGLRVGVDAYVWLHRGVFGCAAELCQGKDTKRYLHACFKRLNLLLSNGIGQVCIVFDGGPLPAKRGTEDERRARREENRRKALQLVAEGRPADAFPYFTKAVEVTPAMAKEWMNTIEASGLQNVTCVVAPYEADAQLAYLCRTGQLDAVFTEDSDLLATGCPRVLFKLEEATGMAQQVLHADIFRAPIPGLGDLRTWDGEAFLVMCILSGCDYLSSVAGLGLRSACRLVHRHKTATKAIRAMRFEAKHKIPADYEARFLEALKTFRHQRVFDPVARVLTHVHPLPLGNAPIPTHPPASVLAAAASTMDYLGPWMEDALAAEIADGIIDPITLAPFPPSLSTTHFAATCAASTTVAACAAAASASASQPKISAFLTAARHRPQEGENRDGEEEEEGEANGGVTTTDSSRFSGAVRRNVIYRPGLRKSLAPVPLHQNNRLTSYLNNKAAATVSVAAAMKSSSSSGSFRTLPAMLRKRKSVSTNSGGSGRSSGAEGSASVSSMPLPPERHEDAPDKATGTGGAAVASTTGILSRLPHLSTWFGGKGENKAHTKKENRSSGGLPSLSSPSSLSPSPSSLLSSLSSSSLVSSYWKRQRTLGGRPTAFTLRRFACGGGACAGGATSAAEEEEEREEVEEGGSRRPKIRLSGSKGGADGGYGSDSLQPPTPGTPYGESAAATASSAEGAAVAAARPLNQADLDETGDDDGVREMAVVNAASAAVAARTTTMHESSHGISTTLISFEPFLYQSDDDNASDNLGLKRGLGKSLATTTALNKTVIGPTAAVTSQSTVNFRRRRPRDNQKQSPAAATTGERGGEGGRVEEGDGKMSLSLDAFKFDAGDGPFLSSLMP